MRRTEMLQEIRRMRFEEAYGVWTEGRLTQEEAARKTLGSPIKRLLRIMGTGYLIIGKTSMGIMGTGYLIIGKTSIIKAHRRFQTFIRSKLLYA